MVVLTFIFMLLFLGLCSVLTVTTCSCIQDECTCADCQAQNMNFTLDAENCILTEVF